nr:Uncharacterised protein [Klebsiella pneumoniae]
MFCGSTRHVYDAIVEEIAPQSDGTCRSPLKNTESFYQYDDATYPATSPKTKTPLINSFRSNPRLGEASYWSKTWPLTRSWGARLPLCCSITPSARISWLMVPPQMFPTVVVTLFIHGAR